MWRYDEQAAIDLGSEHIMLDLPSTQAELDSEEAKELADDRNGAMLYDGPAKWIVCPDCEDDDACLVPHDGAVYAVCPGCGANSAIIEM